MQLIEKISRIESKYAMSGLSEQAISVILGRDGLVEDGIRFLVIEYGKMYFDVPEQDWSEDTNQMHHFPRTTFAQRIGEIYNSLEKIGGEYHLQPRTSNVGFSMNWLNDAQRRLDAFNYFQRLNRTLPGEKVDEKQLKDEAKTIEIARIHPRYLVFNNGQAHFAGLDSYQNRDIFLDKIVQAAYRKS